MSARLIFAIISTTLEEAAIVVIVLWGLPQMDIHIPVWLMIIGMIGWLTYSTLTFKAGTRALNREQVVGLPDMIGTKGRVINALTPDGLVRIRGELWVAKTADVTVSEGKEILVIDQERMKLLVSETTAKGKHPPPGD